MDSPFTALPAPQLRGIILIILIVLVSACSTTPTSTPLPAPDLSTPNVHDTAQQASARGDYRTAATLYLDYAQTLPQQNQAEYFILAIEALLAGNHNDDAKLHLSKLARSPLTEENQAKVLLLNATLLLKEQAPQKTIELLSSASADTIPANLVNDLYLLRAEAYLQTGQRELAAQALMRSLENTTFENIELENRLWPLLATIPRPSLAQLADESIGINETGWLALAQIYHQQTNISVDFGQQISQWQNNYPDHPASTGLINSLLELERSGPFQPKNIALLLPDSGPFAKPAAAIRDGFAAAFYQSQKADFNPTLRFYNSGTLAEQTLVAYEQAVADGADVIIGPLNKDGVSILAAQESLPVPTLALNYSTSSIASPANLFQFGLAPEDEAKQVAERAWLDGHNQAILVTPDSLWGERIASAFTDAWSLFGGIIVETTTYASDSNNFSGPLQEVLNLDDSKARKKLIGRFVGQKIHSEPRRRQDIDFVFIAAQPRQARQIRPQLKFFYAAKLPVYATSHVYTGTPNPAADRDMDGIRFCDMPWTIDADQNNTLWQTIASSTTGNIAPLKRLYALGVDSYELLPHLPRLSKYRYQHFPGKTGLLHIQENNRIFRDLKWAQFVKGAPRPIATPTNF